MDAWAAQVLDHSAVDGCQELFPAPGHDFPFLWALADAGVAKVVPDARARQRLVVRWRERRSVQGVPLAELHWLPGELQVWLRLGVSRAVFQVPPDALPQVGLALSAEGWVAEKLVLRDEPLAHLAAKGPWPQAAPE